MRDTNLTLKATGAVTTTTSATSVDFGAGDKSDIQYVLLVTAVTGTSPTVDVTLEESSDDSTFVQFANFPQVTSTDPAPYRISTRSDQRYRRAVFTTGGTSPSFTCSLYPELGGQYDSY